MAFATVTCSCDQCGTVAPMVVTDTNALRIPVGWFRLVIEAFDDDAPEPEFCSKECVSAYVLTLEAWK